VGACVDTNKSGCVWTKVADIPASQTSYTDNLGSSSVGVYYYGLHAVDGAGNVGVESAPIKVEKVAPTPSTVNIVARVNGTVVSPSDNNNCGSTLTLVSGSSNTAGCVRTISPATAGIYSLQWLANYPTGAAQSAPTISPASQELTSGGTITFYLDFTAEPVVDNTVDSTVTGGPKCTFDSPDMNDQTVYAVDDQLVWGNTHRVMWQALRYDVVPLHLRVGQNYTFSFYYKGRVDTDISMYLCYNLGWCSQYNSQTNAYSQAPVQTAPYNTLYFPSILAGNYTDWARYTTTFEYTAEMNTHLDSNYKLHNEIGMAVGYNNTGSLGTDFYIDDVQFEEGTQATAYKSPTLLPDIAKGSPHGGPSGSGVLREYFFKNPESQDAVALRIYSNPDHLSPRAWYDSRTDIVKGSPQTLTVDGYEAIKDGQTVYVNAVNQSGQDLYTNIYVLTFNQGADKSTQEIVQQLLTNWQFNINLNEEQKTLIRRDLQRARDVKAVKGLMSAYRKNNNRYPTLDSGTYRKGLSVSAWSSWQSALGNAIGQTLPTDPINAFKTCPAGYSATTCWNSTAQQYTCPDGSRVYQYQSSGPSAYEFKANFEYKNVTWRGNMDIAVPAGDSCDNFIMSIEFKNGQEKQQADQVD
jgi:hypothetical protein